MFRRYEPGYNPWFINQEECLFLTHALRQTVFVAGDVLAGRLKMDMEKGRTILRHSEEKDGKIEWHSQEIQLLFPKVLYTFVEFNDEILTQRLKKAGSIKNVTLQADTCYMPSAVQEERGERPYFPRIFILAEQKSGRIVDYEMYRNIRDDAKITLHKFIDLCLKNGVPEAIQIRSEAMTAILGDFCRKTGIKLKVVRRLSAIDQFLEEMAYRF